MTLPLLKPTFLVLLVLRTLFSFMVFDEVMAITYGGPGDSTWVATWYIYANAFVYFKLGVGSAAAFLLSIAIGLVAVFYMRVLYGNRDRSDGIESRLSCTRRIRQSRYHPRHPAAGCGAAAGLPADRAGSAEQRQQHLAGTPHRQQSSGSGHWGRDIRIVAEPRLPSIIPEQPGRRPGDNLSDRRLRFVLRLCTRSPQDPRDEADDVWRASDTHGADRGVDHPALRHAPALRPAQFARRDHRGAVGVLPALCHLDIDRLLRLPAERTGGGARSSTAAHGSARSGASSCRSARRGSPPAV